FRAQRYDRRAFFTIRGRMTGRVLAFFLLLLAVPKIGWSQSVLNFPKHFTPAELASGGFAIANPNTTATATVTFTLYSVTGQVVKSVSRTFGPGTQKAELGADSNGTGQLFGNVASLGSGGWVQATSSTSGLVGFWLVFDSAFSVSGDGAETATALTTQVI